MKGNLPALLFLLFIALNSIAQLNYERKQTINFNDNIGSFATAEINQDNRLDLVFSYLNQNYIAYRLNMSLDTMYLNVQYGTMTRISLEKKSSKRALHICDINNDTFEDILFSEYDNSRIGIAINNKQSQFKDIYYFNSGSNPTKILSADFNNDHLIDIAVICEESKQVQVYLGNTSSMLSEPVSYFLSGTASDMELKDMNADGAFDIVVSEPDHNKFQLFTGNGDGTFTEGLTVATKTAPSNIEIADINKDQLPDIVVVSSDPILYSNPAQIYVFYQTEDHTFTSIETHTIGPASPLDFVVDDLNGDGHMDMAMKGKSDQIELLLGKDDNLFTPSQCSVYGTGNVFLPIGFIMKPVYYPNKLSFLFVNYGSCEMNSISLNADFTTRWGECSIIICSQAYHYMDIADMNGDNIKDLILVYNAAKCAELYFGKNNQSYQFVKNIPFNIDANKIKIYDINLDGYPDIIASGSNISEVLINDGNNNFQSTILRNVGYANVLVLDVNNNGNPDLLLNSNLYLDVKDGDYSTITHFPANSFIDISAMDFNKDGKTDLCVSEWNYDRLSIYPGKGNGTFGTKINLYGAYDHMTVGDVDKDGFDDIVASSNKLNELILYRNNQKGNFTQEIIRESIPDLYNVFILDFDHNENEDIVITGPPSLSYYPVNDDGTIAAEKKYLSDNALPENIFLTDGDNDGNKDLFLLNTKGITKYSNKVKAQLMAKNLVQTYDGFQVDDILEKTIPAGLFTYIRFNGSLTWPKSAGTYQAHFSISDDLYKGTLDTVLVVNKAPLKVKAVNKIKDYGSANPAFKIEYSGFVNGEAADFIDVAPTVSCSADINTSAGSYPIVVDGGSDNNYELNYENGTLTVNKKKLTVQPVLAARKYGEKEPAYSLSYTGFVNNETSSVIDKAPVISTLATSSSPAGVYDLTASSGEDNNYDFEYLKGSLTIEKAPLTIKADYKTKKYGEENPKLTLTATGFANNETLEVIDQLPSASTMATKLSPVGSFDIVLSGGMDNNYQLEIVKGILNINKAPLTIKAANKTKPYGEENPSLTLIGAGFVNNDGLETIDQLPVASTKASVQSSAGSYDIELSGGVDSNYEIELQKGNLTIEKAPLTIKAEDKYKIRGEENPELTISATGFVNNETMEVIDQLPVAYTLAEKDSPAGNYAIDLSGGYDNNYDLIFVSGNLKIDYPLAVNETSASQMKIYPVPAKETLYVENIGPNILSLRMVDTTGGVVKTIKVHDQNRLSISVSDLSSGLYFLETVDKDHQTKRYKLMVD